MIRIIKRMVDTPPTTGRPTDPYQNLKTGESLSAAPNLPRGSRGHPFIPITVPIGLYNVTRPPFPLSFRWGHWIVLQLVL